MRTTLRLPFAHRSTEQHESQVGACLCGIEHSHVGSRAMHHERTAEAARQHPLFKQAEAYAQALQGWFTTIQPALAEALSQTDTPEHLDETLAILR